MAPPLNIDTALYRMKAYSGLLLASTTDEQKDIGQDIRTLIEWIEYARPLLGAVTTEAQAVNPFARHGLGQGYHGMQQGQQMDFNTAIDPGKPPANAPDPDKPVVPAEGGGDAEKPAA